MGGKRVRPVLAHRKVGGVGGRGGGGERGEGGGRQVSEARLISCR